MKGQLSWIFGAYPRFEKKVDCAFHVSYLHKEQHDV